MTAKEYLSQLDTINMSIKDGEEEIKKLQEQAESIGATDYSKDVVKNSGKPYANFEQIVDSIVQREQKIKRRKAQYLELQLEIGNQIDAIENPIERSVLHKRYIQQIKDFSRIATEIGYGYRHTTRLHGEALQSFSKLYGFPKDVL